ncbi:MAG TPA: tRNA lysidine(34) synthetase TilS [Gemmatimonadaceae bacterium]|nr:tRNA lysidine(34) synthetase TilS [Gemmatimonadaceae bacterium]
MVNRRFEVSDAVENAVADALASCSTVLLAVSGGLDSMTLMHAASKLGRSGRKRILVGTFDHGTGPAARNAAALVTRESARRGLECIHGEACTVGTREEEWRRARWDFLQGVAALQDASVVTAHTRDDQIETVFMRILRDAGPRGLAGLYAESEILRPFLGIRRQTLERYAKENRIRFVEDPSNKDRRHLRNRVRLDILPSIVKRRPGFPDELLALARQAADWRRSLEEVLPAIEAIAERDGGLRVSRSSLRGYDADSLRVLWPALAARASVVMDRRGTHRAAEFTMKGATGGAIQLSGGVEIVMSREHMLLRRVPAGQMRTLREARA